MDRKTRKLLTIYGGFHSKSDVDRLYVPREKGGRVLMEIKETVRYEEQSLYKFDGKVDDIMRTVQPYMKEGRDVITAKELKAEQARNRLEGWQG